MPISPLSRFILSIYLTLFGHHHQSSANKIAWKIFLSRIFLSHLHKLLLLILTPRPFLFSNFLIPILFRLRRNTSSCQLSAYSYHRETWYFSQFYKKKPILQKIGVFPVFSLISVWEMRFHSICSEYIYHWWARTTQEWEQ